jgi:hypothetical protein
MKIIAKFDNGQEVELKELQCLNYNCDIVIIKSHHLLDDVEKEKIEKDFSIKFKRDCVVLDKRYDVIGTLGSEDIDGTDDFINNVEVNE